MREMTELRNGMKIPQIGLGTWQITDRKLIELLVVTAYGHGYRLFDIAAAYGNEISFGKAVSEAAISRQDIFITDKAWNTSRGYEAVQAACRKSLKKLKTDYLDIYLIHWPASMKLHSDWEQINAETWRGMEALYRNGLVRAIGVCNFKRHHLEALEKTAEILPFLNQAEIHPGMLQSEMVEYCREKRIKVQASSPLGNGQILANERLSEIAREKRKSVAQVCLRWAIQKGLAVIPKTSNVNRLPENLDIYDFELALEDMISIDTIPYCGGLGLDSDEVIEFG